jgi:hypothetical protein
VTAADVDFARWRRQRNRRYWQPAEDDRVDPVEVDVCPVCGATVFDDPDGTHKGAFVRMLDGLGATDGHACAGDCADRYWDVVRELQAAYARVLTVDDFLDADSDRDVWHTSLADLRRENELLNPPPALTDGSPS